MGNLLVAPVTDKDTHRGQTTDGELSFAVSSMQGWRVHMEDAHICEPSLYAEERVFQQTQTSSSNNGNDASSESESQTETQTGTAGDVVTNSSGSASTSTPTNSSNNNGNNNSNNGDNETDATDTTDTTATSATTISSSTSNANDNNNSNINEDAGGQMKKAKTSRSSNTLNQNNNNKNNSSTTTSISNSKIHSKQNQPFTYQKIDLPDHSLFAVFDGHGGTFAAQYASLNFVRVLARQPSFVQYAKFIQEQQQEQNNNDNTNNNNDTGTNTNNPSLPKTLSLDDRSKSMTLAHNHRKGLELLEDAFRDAFLDIDREIWRIVQHLHNQDCILPSRHQNNNNDDDDHNNNTNQHNNQDENKNNDNDDNDDDDGDHNMSGVEYHPQQNDNDEYIMQDSGTTAVAVMLTPQYIICANAGDSRSVYSKQNNSTIPLSYDHKPDDEEEEQRIRDAGGFVRVGRVDGDLAVSRGLGDFRFKEYQLYKSMGTTVVADMPHLNSKNRDVATTLMKRNSQDDHDDDDNEDHDEMAYVTTTSGGNETRTLSLNMLPDDQKVSPVPDIIVQKRDRDLDEFIVIACDGVFDVQSNQDCIGMTAQMFKEGETDLGLVCEEILDLCLEKGSKDNMTALVIKFPAQPIGEGGGVTKRREIREQMQAQDAQQQEQQGANEGW